MGNDHIARDRRASIKNHASDHRRYQPARGGATPFPALAHAMRYPEAAGLISLLRCWHGTLEHGLHGVRLAPPVDPLTPPRFFNEVTRLQPDLIALFASMGDAPALTGRILLELEPDKMAFMKSAKKSDFMPRIKYSAMTGDWSVTDYDFETRSNTDTDVETPFKVLFDFGSIQTGVVYFPPGGAPDVRVVPEGEDLPDYPQDEDEKGNLLFKPCIILKMFSPVLGGAREAMLTSAAARTGVEDLYTMFTGAPEAQTGKVPLVLVKDAVAKTFGKGRKTTLYSPGFDIVGWAERVPEFGVRTVRPPQPSLPLSRPSTGVVLPAKPSWAAAPLEDDEIPW